MKYRNIGLLSAGHLVTDINQGALPAMLPFFISAYDLSYAAAASLVFAANMTSSVVQPLFGLATDRVSKPWLLIVGMLLAGGGLGLTGIFHDYTYIMTLAVVSGIGIAAYHPEAARLINFAAGAQKGAAMSLFGVGGAVGFAVGPLLVTTTLYQWGLKGSLILIAPVILLSFMMAGRFSTFTSLEMDGKEKRSLPGLKTVKENWMGFGLLTFTVIGKSVLFYSLNTFIPIYWVSGLSQSKAAGAMALTIFAGAGILGTVLGGGLADRMGPKKVIVLGYLGMALFLPMLIMFKNIALMTFLLIPIGITVSLPYSPTIVLGQHYLPDRVGLSSGVTLGLAVAIGGAAAPIIGKIADRYGVWYSLASIVFLPIFIAVVAMLLPGSDEKV